MMDHYVKAENDLRRSYGDNTDDGTAQWRASVAQVHATLALADAIRGLVPRLPDTADRMPPAVTERILAALKQELEQS